jgi:hypothetical protein
MVRIVRKPIRRALQLVQKVHFSCAALTKTEICSTQDEGFTLHKIPIRSVVVPGHYPTIGIIL